MKRNYGILSALLSMAAFGGIGSEAFALQEPKRPNPITQRKSIFGRKRRHSNFVGRGTKHTATLTKRAAVNLRAAQMNYKGWCGRPESGELRAA